MLSARAIIIKIRRAINIAFPLVDIADNVLGFLGFAIAVKKAKRAMIMLNMKKPIKTAMKLSL